MYVKSVIHTMRAELLTQKIPRPPNRARLSLLVLHIFHEINAVATIFVLSTRLSKLAFKKEWVILT